MNAFALVVDSNSLFHSFRALLSRAVAALPTATPAWIPLVIETDAYVLELNRALQAHPAYEKGMHFHVPAELANDAGTDDIAYTGPARLEGIYREVMEDVSLRFELA
jgi:hypothetical protein